MPLWARLALPILDPVYRIAVLMGWYLAAFVLLPVTRATPGRTKIDDMMLEGAILGMFMQYRVGLRGLPGSMAIRVMRRMVIGLAILSGLAATAEVSPAFADVSDGDITIEEVHAFQDVVEDGDIFVIARFEMDKTAWRNATCAAAGPCLEDTTCADATDFLDPCYVSILPGIATSVLLDGTGNTVAIRQFPRIGVGLAGVYLCAPDSILDPPCTGQLATTFPFDDPAENVMYCIKGPVSVSPRPSACVDQTVIQWHASTTLAATEDLLRLNIVPMMLSLTTAASVSRNLWVDGFVVTNEGAIFVLEALPALLVVAPSIFDSSVLSSVVPGYSAVYSTLPTSLPEQALVAQQGGLFRIMSGTAALLSGGGAVNVTGVAIANVVALALAIGMFVFIIKLNEYRWGEIAGAAAWIVLLDMAILGMFMWAILGVLTLLIVAIGAANFFRNQLP